MLQPTLEIGQDCAGFPWDIETARSVVQVSDHSSSRVPPSSRRDSSVPAMYSPDCALAP
jgi:hypothetical protein